MTGVTESLGLARSVDQLATGLRRLPGHPAALFGPGASRRLAEVFDALGTRRCLVVRGNGSYDRCGIASSVERAGAGRRLWFVRAAPWRTTIAEVGAGLQAVADFRPDTVLAVGGGSALDLAKAITNLASAGLAELAAAIAGNQVLDRQIRLVLLPTTAGSGSELTRFATLWDGTRKLSLDAAGLRADIALVDPDLTASAPHEVAVAAAADALCQSVESSWAVAATAQSREWAARAYQTLLPAIAAGCERGSLHDPELRIELALGASLAGAAIDVSRTTAAHALSYPLTAGLGLPHGAAVGIWLPWLTEHNRSAAELDSGELPDAAELSAHIDRLDRQAIEQAGCPLGPLLVRLLELADYPVDPSRLPLDGAVGEEVLAMPGTSRMCNNPRAVSRNDLLELLGRS